MKQGFDRTRPQNETFDGFQENRTSHDRAEGTQQITQLPLGSNRQSSHAENHARYNTLLTKNLANQRHTTAKTAPRARPQNGPTHDHTHEPNSPTGTSHTCPHAWLSHDQEARATHDYKHDPSMTTTCEQHTTSMTPNMTANKSHMASHVSTIMPQP